MEKMPMVIFLRKKIKSVREFGFTQYEWEKLYIDYLRKLEFNKELPQPIQTVKKCTILNDTGKQKIASFKTTVKLSLVRNQSSIISDIIVNKSPSQSVIPHKTEASNDIFDERTGKSDYKKSLVTTFISNDKLHLALSEDSLIDVEDIDINIDHKKSKVKELKTWKGRIWSSTTDLNKMKYVSTRKSKSTSAIKAFQKFNILNYIYGDINAPHKSVLPKQQVYYVGYFTVEPNKSDSRSGRGSRSDKTNDSQTDKSDDAYRTTISDINKSSSSSSSESVCIFSKEAELSVTQCKKVECENRVHRDVHTPPDPQVLLDLENMNKICCDKTEKVEEVVGGITAKMKLGNDPCFCTCECTFSYTKKTTLCGICGGYEKLGEEYEHAPKHSFPMPCPVYHKLMDKNKLKVLSTSGSDTKKKEDSGQKSVRTGSKSGTSSDKRSIAEKKSESEKDRKKERKDDRFKFNYGYKAPQIGHMHCAMPCTGTLGPVPRNMGWLWTADNVPGLKFNPQWKPGAIHKFVYRMLKLARNPGDVIAKKRRKDTGKKKRPLKRPLLVVSKKNGEYTVTMETMKNYAKPRQLNQQPYEDKPVMTYVIGRTEEENLARQKKKEREQRRLERAQRMFIQSAFKDMCQEICLKTYQQALGILPDAEDPKCICYPAEPGPDKTNVNVSCSCSEVSGSFNSDTDSDEWVIEFTPPNASFDPTFKCKKVAKFDKYTQYSYLDFRVKLLDRFGNPVPRFFKGPDGKQQCSDLGGFWSPDHKWLEINVDGYIGPDERWAPNIFIGPNGETVDAEAGKFQATDGRWLVVGVDGYVDCQGQWRWYNKSRGKMSQKRPLMMSEMKNYFKYKKDTNILRKSPSSWSCFVGVSPLQLSARGITGHGADRKLLRKKLEDLIKQGIKVQTPPTTYVLSNTKMRSKKKKTTLTTLSIEKCKHSLPSDKGVEAVDEYGNKTYFRFKRSKNKRPKQRMDDLAKHGISLSSFHVPCFHSFINSEIIKQQQRKRFQTFSIVSKGWKPGAISKRLLRKLNKAKRSKLVVQEVKHTKKTKKRKEEKATLIISKIDGEYKIEMQAMPDGNDESLEQFTPLIYKIANADNEDRKNKKERLKRRILRRAAKDIKDSYNPKACDEICLNAYKHAVGILKSDDYFTGVKKDMEKGDILDSCSCSDIELSSCTSSEVDWEIHFSPPLSCLR
ncbi:hypothetical protein RR48_12595 [Papilio machaon]|uniref:DUF4776 domain-containing protein n=1 Tax=Papilio machaon TaxID=76193 RepID=A0A194RNV0_PAPMA|nr:hypothetical protein RR48_12595 [Papilio machaon]